MVAKFLRAWFGDFSKEELIKFLLLGTIFTFLIGAYWTLRPLKDSILTSMCGAGTALAWGKIFSLLFVFPVVIAYSKVVDALPRHKLFYIICGIYAALTLLLGGLMFNSSFGVANAIVVAQRTGSALFMSKVLGYSFYVFVESFGSIVIALFWAFVTDITASESAKRGFPVVMLVGQIGGIVFPQLFKQLVKASFIPVALRSSALAVCADGVLMIIAIALMMLFIAVTPKSQLVGYHGKNEDKVEKEEEEAGFFEGLRLMFSKAYLFGIFLIITFFEIIVTVFDFHFKNLVATTYAADEVAKTAVLNNYGSMATGLTFICLLLGINNIQRYMGLTVSLALMPVLIAVAVFGFWQFPGQLTFLMGLMVASKAVNYALNSPSQKQLYIPVTKTVRFKSQAWIESFGSRGAKAAGSGVNMLKSGFEAKYGAAAGLLHHVAVSSYLGLGMAAMWFVVAIYLGRTHKRAIDTKQVVC
jgi:AAA family ATP:ADP antiporter